jgi:hypothetical protein
VRGAVRAATASSACLLNYRKDGLSFWNHAYLHPILADDGRSARARLVPRPHARPHARPRPHSRLEAALPPRPARPGKRRRWAERSCWLGSAAQHGAAPAAQRGDGYARTQQEVQQASGVLGWRLLRREAGVAGGGRQLRAVGVVALRRDALRRPRRRRAHGPGREGESFPSRPRERSRRAAAHTAPPAQHDGSTAQPNTDQPSTTRRGAAPPSIARRSSPVEYNLPAGPAPTRADRLGP